MVQVWPLRAQPCRFRSRRPLRRVMIVSPTPAPDPSDRVISGPGFSMPSRHKVGVGTDVEGCTQSATDRDPDLQEQRSEALRTLRITRAKAVEAKTQASDLLPRVRHGCPIERADT